MKSLSIFALVGILCFSACADKNKTILIKNTLDFDRSVETVELTAELLNVPTLETLGIKDADDETLQITQLVDYDGDGTMDVLLFQPKIKANTEKKYEIVNINPDDNPKTEVYCYSRFVPERTDDYAWENNRVAFRIFGPDAQYRAENNLPQPTLSSGVDAWLKRVEYPIINKWYKKNAEKGKSYHKDSGEGLDNFHVGISRGVGGIAVKRDTSFYYSKNFKTWKTITIGPIRTSFQVTYEDWDADGNIIKESKTISLDYGNNLSKFETHISGTDIISAGITLHEKDGEVTSNMNEAWTSYWQPHGDSELGTAIVTTKDYLQSFEKYDTESKDESNAYAHLNIINGKTVYYAGFGWAKSGQFSTEKEWQDYLSQFSKQINTPLEVRLTE
ncbi:DUF4861 domain-containing protein [Tamlana fucoidanivorans]|uniref:DUF4861 domain-containing protein n=1 Tax=Allotamlana fucoidanivorans TaxID=2583814 RepID=A0A5C4SI85_9FLAO|nr:DUF4861 family protein [Tamlana fucoidanivorans]TNJ42519.1 DUF4861 domain-containing protein [Tamlana fucoidanivorans]